MKSRKPFSMIAVLLLAPAALQAQGTESGTKTQAQGDVQTQVRTPQARIDAAMQAAVRAKVPVSLLESKIAEGEAKQVPQERIAAAVEARVAALIKASEAMSRSSIKTMTEGELAVAADALQAGVSAEALIEISQSAPAERRVVAVAVLTDLVRIGEKPEPAVARVQAALASNVALANLQAEVASKLRLGGLSSTLEAAGVLGIK